MLLFVVIKICNFIFNSLYVIQDQSKDKPIELEMGWLCAETKYKYSLGKVDCDNDDGDDDDVCHNNDDSDDYDCNEHDDTSYKSDDHNNIAVNSAERSSNSRRHSSKGGLTRSDLNSRYRNDDYDFVVDDYNDDIVDDYDDDGDSFITLQYRCRT